MKKTNQISGVTCGSCVAKVQSVLNTIKGVKNVEVSKEKDRVTITSDFEISLENLTSNLPDKYHISEAVESTIGSSWWITYKPVLLIFVYLFSVSLLVEWSSEQFNTMRWMRHFMAGFFLVFSFFKMLDLQAFKNSYVMYDVLAKKFPVWAYLYAFTELFLGVSLCLNVFPFVIHLITLVVMSISIVGVLQSVLNKQKIQCACLGGVFNLPMSTVTIIEDALMILMSAVMLLYS